MKGGNILKQRLVKAASDDVVQEVSDWLATEATDDEIINLVMYECSSYYDEYMVNTYYPMDELDEMLASASPTDIILMTQRGDIDVRNDYFAISDKDGNLYSYSESAVVDDARNRLDDLAEVIVNHADEFDLPQEIKDIINGGVE
jgi:hypothetical protein|nr:MAG TPA: hypothetical protein [Caudoviricetes sp.]